MKRNLLVLLMITCLVTEADATIIDDYFRVNKMVISDNHKLICNGEQGVWFCIDDNSIPYSGDAYALGHPVLGYADKPAVKVHLKDGKMDGLARGYDKNGQLLLEQNYKDGILDGIEKYYYNNGKVRREQKFTNGKRNGTNKSYYENGNLEFEINYENDKENGTYKHYYDNGQLISECHYKDGKKNGVCKYYHLNGQLFDEYHYKDDKKDGYYRNYSEDGQLLIEGNYKNDEQDGNWKKYFHGQVFNEYNVKNGEREVVTDRKIVIPAQKIRHR